MKKDLVEYLPELPVYYGIEIESIMIKLNGEAPGN